MIIRRNRPVQILLLEDDILFCETLEDFLDDEGYIVHTAKDGEEALSLNFENNYDLYLLDINVPKLNGLELLKELRQSGDNTPAIFLTSYKDKETLKEGFLNGADDYLTKPVDMEELLLRMNSLLKRSGKQQKSIKVTDELIFNPVTKRILKNGEDLNAPVKVTQLFELCLENRQAIVTKEMIVDRLWSVGEEYSEGSIRVYINNVKKLLGNKSISNIKGVGYKIEF
jgi:DNA-binding response OmpR family regulator